MDDPTVYTDPGEPGAPQVGDMVMGAFVHDRWYLGVVGSVEAGICWRVDPYGPIFRFRTIQVRRPTEAELAAWILAQPGGSHE